ncbi:MAG TPA: TonB-dependent receptor [Flavobacteriaceae bacterium]|nr:TonB-dependent receptor [Flavobacteriaceae bacterium]
MRKLLCFCCLIYSNFVFCQILESLEEVVITADAALREYSDTQNVVVLNDSIFRKSPALLTGILQYNTHLYLKENGLGMVSSPSFRGTTAAQTAVVWNGININALSVGQTDFNSINIRGFDYIAVKAGGGSTAYGSSAIGGTVHLNNDLSFKNPENQHKLYFGYGSFDTYDAHVSSKWVSNNSVVQIGLSRNASKNDYPLYNKDFDNTNGQFFNNNLSVAIAQKLNKNHQIRFYGNVFDGERHFSVISPQAIKTKFADFNLRNLLEWNADFGSFNSSLKLAYLFDNYRYFPYVGNDTYTFGNFDSKIFKYNLKYRSQSHLQINLLLDYMQNQGEGSDIRRATRQTGAVGLMVKNRMFDKILYELMLKQEITDSYTSPLLYSAGVLFEITNSYSTKAHFSKNFRIPTFNDMYWQGSGNPDLQPEVSLQGEWTHQLGFDWGGFSLTGYYNDIQNMLRWEPVTGSLWKPENIGNVVAYGLEYAANFSRSWGKSNFSLTGNYAYTVSKNKENEHQLVYVPYHKGNASLVFSRKRYTFSYRYLYVGKVYTTSDNESGLSAYQLSEVGMEYIFKNNYTIGFQVLNLWNEKYSSVQNRPMPGRNINFYINLNF